MASLNIHFASIFFFILVLVTNNYTPCKAQLSPTFYDGTCPNALRTIRTSIRTAISRERRMAASLLRLHFHDCFVQGCDASILLEDDPSNSIVSERNALPNKGSVRGYEVIEAAKSEVEKLCPGVVSCADILTVAARDASEMVGGPSWSVKLGRRDSTTASLVLAESSLPSFKASLDSLIKTFDDNGLSARDMVALSGAHTIGQAQCFLFRDRIYNNGSDIDAGFASTRRRGCPINTGNGNLAPLDLVTPNSFDYNYFKNLIQKKGLLESDQVLFSGGSTDSIVSEYSNNPSKFKSDFAAAMVKMADIKPLMGEEGVIRRICAMSLGSQAPDILGDRQSGQDVRTQNITACQSVSNIVKTSLGPVGLDKMLVDDIGDVTITNDGATILKMLDVEHPAAKVLVELAELQDREVGDGTTSVVIIAAELLKRANDLVKNKIHPTSVISGYRLAMREACKYIEEKLAVKVDKLGKDSLVNCAKTSMSSKLLAGDSDFFANLVVEAVQAVKMTNARGEIKYPIKGINILKAHGKSAKESYLLKGYALNTGRAAQGMPTRVAPARIACLDFNLQKTKMQLGVQVLVTDPRELEKIRQREADMTKERIEKLLKAGANVVLTTKGIDDMALKYFVEAGAIAVRRVRKEDLRHVAKATGATAVSTFADMEGEETFDSSFLGYADEVVEERIADDDVIMIKGTKTSSAVSLILRGANDYMLDEMDRALHDALCIVKRTLESNTVVAGGGAVEAALSVYLEYLATTLGSREQLAIAEFAESLFLPSMLQRTQLIAKLRAYHHTAQTKADKKHLSSMGLDLVKGTVRNNLEAGVIEPAMSKVKILQFATEAAITILRIDDMIRLVKDESQDGQDYN
ncbi:LOW QUALITY PROTEIN: hypothetical protein OSB04_008851 [Centaurea solstitialis]|uniref:Basic peroxidase n=1 Tax=Centaurea solstitialis TaxID=347529 RepID=A0AA38WU38_9ASTR|nr:LOW QUALITY PROTEIN: hypothetical protein OSB04_008851 [Centaurea solstitialis]